jgi:type IV secretory pathway TrbF-like protein
VQPFVVETDKGVPYAIRPVDATLSANDQRLINFALDQFIINTRTVLGDPKAEGMLLDKAYAYAADGALDTLQSWFSQNNPYETAKKQTVSVNIVDAMPLSKNTWQIIWDETTHANGGGSPPTTTRWMANVSYRIGEVNPKFINQNPFGLYVTDVSWSKSQQN